MKRHQNRHYETSLCNPLKFPIFIYTWLDKLKFECLTGNESSIKFGLIIRIHKNGLVMDGEGETMTAPVKKEMQLSCGKMSREQTTRKYMFFQDHMYF